MKAFSRKPSSLAAFLFAAMALAGCAATQQQAQEPPSQGGVTQQEHQAHHPQGAAAQPSAATEQGSAGGRAGMMGNQGGMMGGGQGGMMGGGQGGMMGQGGQMDMKSMCDLHERMKNAATPQERSAMMNQYMGNMTPEMRQRHFQMMEQQCR
jgi:hypothetical protein